MTDFIKETQNAVPGAIRLETARMILRDHRLEDLESHHEILSDPEVMYYLPDIMTHSLEESRRDLETSVRALRISDSDIFVN